MPASESQQIPTILWLIQSGGLAPLVLGLVLAVIGVVFVIRPNQMASTILAFLSLLPAIYGLVVVYLAASDYAAMAIASAPPKPTEFAVITGRAMSVSFCGLLGTFLAVFVAILAMSRSGKHVVNSELATSSSTTVRQ